MIGQDPGIPTVMIRAAILLAAALSAVALTGCGRKGDLEPPGGAAAPPVPTVFGTSAPQPPPATETPSDDGFILDSLI